MLDHWGYITLVVTALIAVGVASFRSAWWQYHHRKILAFGGRRADAVPGEWSIVWWHLSTIMLVIGGIACWLLAAWYPWL